MRPSLIWGCQPPLRTVPIFKPQSFEMDKFLSIRTRTPDTYTEARRDILRRSQQLTHKLKEAAVHGTNGVVAASTLPPSLAEEMQNISKKAEKLTAMQGFVLSDDMVYALFRSSMRAGAYHVGIEHWLRRKIIREQRGPPFPVCVLDEMTHMLSHFVLPALPASQHCTSYLSSCVVGGSRGRRVRAAGDEADHAEDVEHHVLLQNPERYPKHLVEKYVFPLWSAADAMGLFFSGVMEEEDVTIPHTSKQNAAVRRLLMSFTLEHSVARDATDDMGKTYTQGALAPLTAITAFYMAMVQCACEVREPALLVALHRAFCAGFLTQDSSVDGIESVRLNDEAWTGYIGDDHDADMKASARSLLQDFASDFISLVFYGLHTREADASVWQLHDLYYALSDRSMGEDALGRLPLEPARIMDEQLISATRAFLSSCVDDDERLRIASLYTATALRDAAWLDDLVADKEKTASLLGVSQAELSLLVDTTRSLSSSLASPGSNTLSLEAMLRPHMAAIERGVGTRQADGAQSAVGHVVHGVIELLVCHAVGQETAAVREMRRQQALADDEGAKSGSADAVDKASVVAACRARQSEVCRCLSSLIHAARGFTHSNSAEEDVLGLSAIARIAIVIAHIPAEQLDSSAPAIYSHLGEAALSSIQMCKCKAVAPPGSSLGIILLMLARSSQWELLREMVTALEEEEEGAGCQWWSSASIDPIWFSEVFCLARDAGEGSICAMLRSVREQLFF